MIYGQCYIVYLAQLEGTNLDFKKLNNGFLRNKTSVKTFYHDFYLL